MDRLRKAVFFLLLALLPAAAALAEELTTDDLLARMEKSEKEVQGLKFTFRQEIIYSLTNEKTTNSGEAVFQKPGSLWLKQERPLQQTIIANGRKVWIYTPSYNQVIVDSWKKWTQNSMVPPSLLQMGSTIGELKKKYSFAAAGKDGQQYLLRMTPKAKEGWQLQLWIDPEKFIPVKARVNAENVAIVTELTNFTVNPQIDKGIFTFIPPKGVDVLNVP